MTPHAKTDLPGVMPSAQHTLAHNPMQPPADSPATPGQVHQFGVRQGGVIDGKAIRHVAGSLRHRMELPRERFPYSDLHNPSGVA